MRKESKVHHIRRKYKRFFEVLDDVLLADRPHSDAQQKWDHLRDTVHNTGLSIFRKKQGKMNNWFEANSNELTLIIEARHAAFTDVFPVRRHCRH